MFDFLRYHIQFALPGGTASLHSKLDGMDRIGLTSDGIRENAFPAIYEGNSGFQNYKV